MIEGTILDITQKVDNETQHLHVRVIDKVNDIRTITAPIDADDIPSVQYFVVTKYLVAELQTDRVFTIYVNQIKSILNEHI